MAISSDFVTPAELTGFVRNVPTPAAIGLSKYLPDRQVNDIEALITSVTRTNRTAQFRAYDTETPIGSRDSWSRKAIGLPPLGQKTVITEEERIRLEALRTGGSVVQQYIDAIYDDAKLNTDAVLWRMELARGDVLVDGKFTLAGENGLTLEADFGVPNTHIVNAATVWTDTANADPIADLRAWVEVWADDNQGAEPGIALMSRKRVSNLMNNAKIRALFATLIGSPSLVTRDSVNRVLADQGLPRIETYDSQVSVGGVTTRIIPQDKVIILPENASDLGYTAWGITAEAMELAGGSNPTLTFEQTPGLVGVVLKDGDPVRTWTKVGAVGMPVITDPNAILIADVA